MAAARLLTVICILSVIVYTTCTKTCFRCQDRKECKRNGTCPQCKPGFFGETCAFGCGGGTYGLNCSSTCGHCFVAGPCRKKTGKCLGKPAACKDGWTPPYCQECVDGRYGSSCASECGHCLARAACDKVTGICPNSTCAPGWEGEFCRDECARGRHGINCQLECGHCLDGAACNRTTGSCPNSQCEPGWTGEMCKNSCVDGRYGSRCESKCGHCVDGAACHKATGNCPNSRCAPGWVGELCQDASLWTPWTEWSSCSVTCADGDKQRTRRCPLGNCVGENSGEIENCQTGQPCPYWRDWSLWSDCSVTCSFGVCTRQRTCVHEDIGRDIRCLGSDRGRKPCDTGIVCPFWNPWSMWGECDATCDVAYRQRSRDCADPDETNALCPGGEEESRGTTQCEVPPCPINGQWGEWKVSTRCDAPACCNLTTCDKGRRMSIRHCNDPRPAHGGERCPGLPMKMGTCFSNVSCPVWSPWGEWSGCRMVEPTVVICVPDLVDSFAFKKRRRVCSQVTTPTVPQNPQSCVGEGTEIDENTCSELPVCKVTTEATTIPPTTDSSECYKYVTKENCIPAPTVDSNVYLAEYDYGLPDDSNDCQIKVPCIATTTEVYVYDVDY